MKIAIIGSGWYGCYVAEYLLDNYKNIDITLIDKNSEIFAGSSYKNQNRLHLGFHYPRSLVTRNKSRKYYDFFMTKYNFLLENIEKNYYVISNKSKIKYDKYLQLFNDFILEDNKFLKNIEGDLINTKEKYINFNKSKNYFMKLLVNKVKFLLNYKVTNINQINDKVQINNNLTFNKIFNCTYNQISISKQDFFYEKCISLLYRKINNIPFDSLTIMDGNFCSLYKYKKDIFTLTNVEYTPLIKSKNFKDIESFDNWNLEEKIKLFEKNIMHYYEDFKKNFKYISYFESYKCKKISINDTRDLTVLLDINVLNIYCGKISYVFELDEYIKKFIS